MSAVSDLLKNYGNQVWSLDYKATLADALALRAEKTSVLCWFSSKKNWWVYFQNGIMPAGGRAHAGMDLRLYHSGYQRNADDVGVLQAVLDRGLMARIL